MKVVKKTFILSILMVSIFLTSATWAQDGLEPMVLEPFAFGELKSLEDAAKEFATSFAEDDTFLGELKAPYVIPNMTEFVPPGANRKSNRLEFDPVLQSVMAPPTMLGPTPAPALSFPGTTNADNIAMAGVSLAPPDTEGDAGRRFYFQMNNVVFSIYNKATGASALPFGLPALPNNLLWSTLPAGNPCRTQNDGDPIVLYDHDAQRWFVSQFAVTTAGFQCIAVSQTANPLGGYWLYVYLVTPGPGGLNDYPKAGVWTDGYYFSYNEFMGGGFIGAAAVAFEKPQMLIGNPFAQGIMFQLPFTGAAPIFFSLQPSHWEGMNRPRDDQPNTYIQAFDDQTWGTGFGPDGYNLWNFSVDWAIPANSTFTALPFINSPAFNANLCGFGPCVPQLGTATLLDTLGQFTMYRLQWRNFTSYDTLIGNHTVNIGGNVAGVRWFELRDNGAGWALFQTGTLGTNAEHRWMGSAAMDSAGNIAVGYSASSAAINPEIRYNTRMNGDPLGTLPGGEVLCVDGTGSQTAPTRWGDYSTMSVDPVDDCTFWYTNEFYSVNSAFNWETQICSFRFPANACQKGFCGNGELDLGETCDNNAFGSQTCASFGFDTGSLTCSAGCNQISTANCCRVGAGSGSWNVPAGPSAGTMFGSLTRAGTPIYQVSATLTGTATNGTFTGTLSDGVAPDPDYTISGSYFATGISSGTFSAQIFAPSGTTSVGTINGTWNDLAGLPSIGSFTIANWSICGP